MKAILVLSLLGLTLAGCAPATREYSSTTTATTHKVSYKEVANTPWVPGTVDIKVNDDRSTDSANVSQPVSDSLHVDHGIMGEAWAAFIGLLSGIFVAG